MCHNKKTDRKHGTFHARRSSEPVRPEPRERKEMNMKKGIAFVVAGMLMLFGLPACAETRLTVSGSGETRVSADTAVISLGVSARNKDVLKAQQTVNETISAIRKNLIAQGVPEEHMNTEFINIYALYDYSGDQEQLAAYSANSTLAIRVTDMQSVGSLIDLAFASGANTLNGISFSASDTEEAKNTAMKKAVENAKKKAEVLAEAAGLKITGIESMAENGVRSYENNIGNVYAKGMETAESEEDAGTVVQSAKLVVSADVSITFSAE